MKTRTVKDVDEETWKLLKQMAKRRRLRMGTLLKEIAVEYKKKPSDSWKKILHAKPLLTETQARGMLKTVAKIRKESGYRNVAIS
ncbi:MAG: hypothetical protein ACRD38_02270 [Nitrososphaerales archaeon]